MIKYRATSWADEIKKVEIEKESPKLKEREERR